ncbi:MAG: hypothetical protein Q8K05_05510 [Polaromonas sp.]|jgi:hypothetical protein|nr:hypothetical protein [Polaromonas sp.]MDP2255504.1 hypothetical protein [Polaromonas sp.]MDP3708897.1 hypothetical protein [Polaromonas sp.]
MRLDIQVIDGHIAVVTNYHDSRSYLINRIFESERGDGMCIQHMALPP